MRILIPEVILCSCHSPEHQIVFEATNDGEVKELSMYVFLNKGRSFWQRVKYGFKYMFGYQSKYGAFDEFIFTKDHAIKFHEISKFLEGIEL